MISARISGSLGVLVEEAKPERRLGSQRPCVCFRSLRFQPIESAAVVDRPNFFFFLFVCDGSASGGFHASPFWLLISQYSYSSTPACYSGPPILLLVLPVTSALDTDAQRDDFSAGLKQKKWCGRGPSVAMLCPAQQGWELVDAGSWRV